MDLAWNLIAIVAFAMAVATSSLDFRSLSSHTLAAMFLMLGLALAIEANFITGKLPSELPDWANWATLPGTLAMLAASQWLRLIRRTAAVPIQDRFGDHTIFVAQLFVLGFGAVQFIWPQWRAEYLTHVLDDPSILREWRFLIFAVPFTLSVVSLYLVIVRTLALQPDAPERLRLIGLALAVPMLVLAFITPSGIAPYCAITGQMTLLITLMQYHVQWGQRGQFMSRFLSPQVAAAVREHGLDEAMHEDRRELSAISCDIRGFSRYAEQHDSAQVITLLKSYYDVVAVVAADHAATIKDYAGDGILLLIGAPIADEHHAQHAMELALDLRERCASLWADNSLGLGIGIASGEVSVGIVGTQPMEYVAVGRAVNLASRLCDYAGDGEILLASRTLQLLPDAAKAAPSPIEDKVQFKGIAEPVPIWVIAPGHQIPRSDPLRSMRRGRWWRSLLQKMSQATTN